MTINDQITFIEEKIFSLSEQVKKIKQEALNPKVEFETGKWYKAPNGKMGCALRIKNGLFCGYGFNIRGEWLPDDDRDWGKECNIPVTEAEVKEALIKEWEKQAKGAKHIDNSTLLGTIRVNDNSTSNPLIDVYEYDLSTDTLKCKTQSGNFWTVYSKGKFARPIVKEEAIKIGGYEVKFCDGNTYTVIDGNPFSKKFWLSAKEVSEHSKAKIMIGCSKQFDVSLDTINQILEKLK